jgi:hypothetical protein
MNDSAQGVAGAVWHCVEGDCRERATVWLTFTVDGAPRSWPFCPRHSRTVLIRARQRRPDVPVIDKRRHGKRWT